MDQQASEVARRTKTFSRVTARRRFGLLHRSALDLVQNKRQEAGYPECHDYSYHQFAGFCQRSWTEILKCIPEAPISTIKKNIASDSKPTINFPLAREVATGDPQASERARDWLATLFLEFRWSSLHACRGEVIEALLMVSPEDELVIKEAEHWLQKRPERHVESIYQRVNVLYNQHR